VWSRGLTGQGVYTGHSRRGKIWIFLWIDKGEPVKRDRLKLPERLDDREQGRTIGEWSGRHTEELARYNKSFKKELL
jgi:hypothetical protein